MTALTEAEIARYQRHIVLKEMAVPVSKNESGAHRTGRFGRFGPSGGAIFGAAGVGTLGLIDDDTVTLSNLQRQILFTDNMLGQDKAQAVADALGALNPHLESHIHKQRLDNDNGAACSPLMIW